MPAGLTLGEELDLAVAENRRYREAIAKALQGLDAAREHGFAQASDVIGDINEILTQPPPAATRRAMPAQLASLRKLLLG
jgi:hypothetical protein